MKNPAFQIPLTLYIHIPWCVRKCPYCDFNSHVSSNGIPEKEYITALLQDLDEHALYLKNRDVTAIFFGGGTPSLFSPEGIHTILQGVKERLSVAEDCEITMEANPGTVDEKHFPGFRQAGVNRLSLGLQSLQDGKLKALGRIHNRENALKAIGVAIIAGFDNFNLDLMHGLPNQTIEDALDDLKIALSFEPPHLSWYQLTLEPNTVFYKFPPTLPDDETLWSIQEAGKKLLETHGLIQYEVSAYSKLGSQCRHNLNYWEFGDYLGIGAGAHSKLTDIETGKIRRHWQMKMPKDYLNPQKPFVATEIELKKEDIIFEFMLNVLRLNEGVPIHFFQERTGLNLECIKPILQKTIDQKLLSPLETRIKPTSQGHLFLNDLVSHFLPDQQRN